jgi:hypothetical protein
MQLKLKPKQGMEAMGTQITDTDKAKPLTFKGSMSRTVFQNL